MIYLAEAIGIVNTKSCIASPGLSQCKSTCALSYTACVHTVSHSKHAYIFTSGV